MRKEKTMSSAGEDNDTPAPESGAPESVESAESSAARSFDTIIANWERAWTNFYQRSAGRDDDESPTRTVDTPDKVDDGTSLPTGVPPPRIETGAATND